MLLTSQSGKAFSSRSEADVCSRKLDLMAELIEADEGVVERLMAALRRPARSPRRGLNVQTYLERAGMWNPDPGEPLGSLKKLTVVRLGIFCEDSKKIDRMLEAAGINTDPKQRVLIRL